MEELGLIERSNSPYINPLRIVQKADGALRLCLDARNVNQYLIAEGEVPPGFNELFSIFQGASFFTSFDLTSSFWQISLAPSSRKYTAFMFSNTIYQFVVVPFGLKTSTSALLRALSQIFPHESVSFCVRFVDECLILSQDINAHLTHLEYVLRKFHSCGLTIKLSKTQWFQKQIKFLGMIIYSHGIKPDLDRVQAILDYRRPKNIRELRSYLGFINFYRKFQPNLSKIVHPLTKLLRKDVKWSWTEEIERAFVDSKTAFSNNVLVCFPQPGRIFYVSTDSSGSCIGAHLYQVDQAGGHHPISFVSRSLNKHEISYSTTELELLAVAFALKKFRFYILGTKVVIRTDHRALTHLTVSLPSSPRLSRFMLALQEYDYTLEYVPGKENLIADCLSRYSHTHEDSIIPNQVLIAALDLPQDLQFQFDNLATLQERDPRLYNIFQRLRKQNLNNDCDRIENGLLYHKFKEKWKLCLPSSCVDSLVQFVHHQYSHIGVRKCLLIIREMFYHKCLKKRIRSLIRACLICQRIKVAPTQHSPMLTIPSRQPREIVAIDFYGPLPPSPTNFRYVLVMVDIATKFVRLYPLLKASGAAVIDCLTQDYIPNYGPVKSLLSDNGTQFTSSMWSEKMRHLQIKSIHISIRHPSANPAERYMSTLAQYMRATLYGMSHNRWSEKLGDIEVSMNDSPHASTGQVPATLFLGRGTPRPWDSSFPPSPVVDVAGILEDAIDSSKKQALDRSRRHNRMKERAFHRFRIGDRVWIRSKLSSCTAQNIYLKFLPKYSGPFNVVEDFGNGSYRIGVPNSPTTKGIYHVTNLKPYHPPCSQN
ncbi:multicellular organismal development [Nesidiocoris tenuis]|uniref:RNA-directed DNA polymerase n=2 Tax=Nesidiocoris tenuis TaxID=355587 RepID=A0ABN7AGX6_9HEMI|nr:multicellular organismal development [Nesidiocoris tenuis]